MQPRRIQDAATAGIEAGSTSENRASWKASSRVIAGGRSEDGFVIDKTPTIAAAKGIDGGPKMQGEAPQSDPDLEIVRRFQSGTDREGAFMVLFDRYGPITYAFLRRRIGNADVAADMNQELFMGVLQSLDRFRGDSSFKTWLFRMAQNRLSNLRRRWRTHLDELPDATPDDLLEDVVTSNDATPDEEYDREERAVALERCLATLPEIQRAVVVGQYYEGVTLEELTRQFKMTNKSGARASLIAAQRKLRRCLEKAGVTCDE